MKLTRGDIRDALHQYAREREWKQNGWAMREPPATRFEDLLPKSTPAAPVAAEPLPSRRVSQHPNEDTTL